MKQTAIILFVLVLIFIGSCRHEIPGSSVSITPTTPPPTIGNVNTPCDPNKIYFQQQVLPILVSNCAKSGCHDNASHRDGVILTSFASVIQTADVEPFRPGNSKIYKVIQEGEMPPAGNTPLTATQKQLIYNWIAQGAQDLVCQNLCGDTVNISFANSVKPILTTKCQGCHSGANPAAGIDFTSYTGVRAQVNNGKLWGAINWNTGFSPMPKNGTKLSFCEIVKIQKWIAQGSPNN